MIKIGIKPLTKLLLIRSIYLITFLNYRFNYATQTLQYYEHGFRSNFGVPMKFIPCPTCLIIHFQNQEELKNYWICNKSLISHFSSRFKCHYYF